MRRSCGKRVGVFAAAVLCTAGLAMGGEPVVGTDVIVGELPDLSNNAAEGVFDAYAVGTTSCNKGNVPLNWFTGGTDNRHPVIGQNLFRLHNGRFEHIGQAWLKHGFTALQGSVCSLQFGFGCTATAGTTLGVGCSDPYSSGLNNGQSGLGPKWQVNAANGLFPYPFDNPSFSGSTARRLKVRTADVNAANFPGARYFVEGQYVCGDDAAADHKNNNASYREVTISGTTETTIAFAVNSTTQREKPAIEAWKVVDPAVTLVSADIVGDGRFILGCKVTQNGGNYTYEYALHNLNSNRCAGSFIVPFPSGTSVTGVGFHDVEYHSGEPNAVNPANPAADDWANSVSADQISWFGASYAGTPAVYTMASSPAFKVSGFTPGTGNDHTANVLRWGTMFNYRFTTTVAPALGSVQIGLWRPGTPNSFSIAIQTPGGATSGASTGPCCIGGVCSITTPGACTGTFGVIGATCTPDPCATGSCCAANGGCTIVSEAGCSGAWTLGGTCTPNICPAPTGACCVSTVCSVTTQAGCSGSWAGAGTTCTASICNNNNLCAAAIPLCDNTPVNGTTAAATNDGTANCGGSGSSPDVWFRYVPATTGAVNLNTCGSAYDTVLSVHTGNCGALTQVACNDDNASGNNACGGGLSSGVNYTMTAGVNYYIRIAGYNGATGTFTVRAVGGGGQGCQNIPTGACCSAGNCAVVVQANCNGSWTTGGTCSPSLCPPLNDTCSNRAGLGLGTQAFDTTNATTDGIAHNPTCLFFGNDQITKDIWFNHPSTQNGTLVIDTCGSAFDTKIAVYDGGGCLDFATRLLACNDDANAAVPNGCGTNSLQSRVSIPVVAGQHYTIRIGGYNNAGGIGQVTLTLTAAVPTGSCCATDGTCTTGTQAACTGAWTSGGTCSPNACPQPTGACCNATACSVTTQAGCTGAFQGVGAACGVVGNPTTCCPANYNDQGGITVQDIFDFLAGYFANDPNADFNGQGGITVQDIFDFLAAYFAGCPG